MNCPACGALNREGRRFCGQCGASLSRACSACGAVNDLDERFCGQCGTVLGDVARDSTPTPAVPVPSLDERARNAERRHVTVLFADLVGFTSLSDTRDAEDVRELLSRYFETARTVITRYGGAIEKFIGDAVMAVWGAQTTQENDAELAVRAALELVDAVAYFGAEVGAPGLRARAGVQTGEAAVTLGAVGQGMVAGDLVNTASRLQGLAEPGTVCVGDSTRQVSEAAIVYEDAGSHQLKGKSEPVRVWRALRVAAGRGGAMRARGLEPPFVGRDRELRLLKEYLHGTAEERTARLLSIAGVAGVGKSRLGWEFFKYVDGLSEVVLWQRGRCLAYGEGVAYWALNEMVRMRAGIVENEPTETAREKLRLTVEEFVEDPEERRWVEPRLAHLVGLEERAATDPRDLYAAWRFFFERLAAQNLTVLLFEDLQWADAGLLDFIEYLLEWSRSSPLLVVTLARPELAEKRPTWTAGRRGVTSLYLEPLSDEVMERLLDGMVPGLPADLRGRIRERAAGVPLYAVETVRMLLDRGLLVQEGGAYRVQGSLESLEVPESLHALIAARLDSLQPDERQLLQDASVLGKSFTLNGLRAITAVPDDAVVTALSGLVNKELLAIQTDPRSPERGQYVFVQDLVRGVAYGTLARRDRKQRHLAAATHLESAWSDEEEVAEVVAAHLVEAYEADPEAADAGTIRDRARDALVKAGDHAAALASAASAQHYYERALRIADVADRADLHFRAGQMAWLRLDVEAARTHFAEARGQHAAAGRQSKAARVDIALAAIDVHQLRPDLAAQRMEDAFASFDERPAAGSDEEADLALVAAELGRRMYLQAGDVDTALERVELALDIAEPRGLWETFCEALNTKGLLIDARGRHTEANALLECALRSALDHRLHTAALRAFNNLAACKQVTDLPRALDLSSEGKELAELVGDRLNQMMGLVGQVPILIDLGRWEEAFAIEENYERNAADEFQDSVIPAELVYALWVHLWRGDPDAAERLQQRLAFLFDDPEHTFTELIVAASAALLSSRGRHREAVERLRPALATVGQSTDGLYVARWLLLEAMDSMLALGELEQLRDLIDGLQERYRAGVAPALDAALDLTRARLAAAEGREADALITVRAAVDGFERMQIRMWAAVARLEQGRLLRAAGREAEAAELTDQAVATLSELGATRWLEEMHGARRPATSSASGALPA